MRSGAILLFCLLLTLGCGREQQTTLKLYCGGGIRPPVDELAGIFQQETGIQVKPSYAGSGVLFTQIELTKEGDLYMPGDDQYLDRAREKGYVTEVQPVAYFIPVLLVARGNPLRLQSLADMARPNVRVGVGDPDACAIGAVTRDIFKQNALQEAIQPNVVLTTVTVIELANAVKLNTIDAALVWDAIAARYTEDTEAISIPREQNLIARISMGLLSFSRQPDVARRFLNFVSSERGKEIFEKHGYTTHLD